MKYTDFRTKYTIMKNEGEMEIMVVEHVKQIPGDLVRGYMLGKNYTEKEAARDYQAVYGMEPRRGWKWMNYLYFELP